IRDKLVTGVQTCALPISPDELNLLKDDHYNRIIPVNIAWIIQEAGILVFGDRIHESERRRVYLASDPDSQGPQPAHRRGAARNRSEERRVGKECKGGWWR